MDLNFQFFTSEPVFTQVSRQPKGIFTCLIALWNHANAEKLLKPLFTQLCQSGRAVLYNLHPSHPNGTKPWHPDGWMSKVNQKWLNELRVAGRLL